MIMLNKQMHLTLLKKRKNYSEKLDATGNSVGSKIANKIKKASRNLPQTTSDTIESETEIPRDIYLQEKDRKLLTI